VGSLPEHAGNRPEHVGNPPDHPIPDSPAVRSLRDEQHVTGSPGTWALSVPMFATWVRVHIGPP
jgi:hypothetical protein